MTTRKDYDALNRLTRVASTNAQNANVSSREYLYTDANQRVRASLADGSYWFYEYDKLGQVKRGVKYWPDGTPVAGQQFEYTFDDIGNRTATKAGGDENGGNTRSATYSANSLNQYTSRTVPGAADILGVARADATVTVNGQAAYRKGEYYQKAISINNASAAVYQSVTNQSVQGGATNKVTGNVFLPKTSESFSYDADGNLTNDGRWMFSWDAENRLTWVESQTSAPTASKRKVLYEYDGQGRLAHRYEYDGSSGSYVLTNETKYVRDGWLCVAELNTTNGLMRSYLWGLDMSGSLTGAGGVGGLVAMNTATNGVHFYAMDGNGNVAALLKAGDGSASAVYEYDPFGQTLRATGSAAKENPYRFSTKCYDDAVDLVLYEYRVYQSSTGRWLNRDPSQEEAGSNLYGFLDNAPVRFVDGLGLWKTDDHVFFTEETFKAVELDTTIKCKSKMIGMLKSANTGQDSCGIGGDLWKYERHYNRTMHARGNVGQENYNRWGKDFDGQYERYLQSEQDNFKLSLAQQTWSGCVAAMNALGRLSHSWQDFYMHAIRRDGQGGKENSYWPGWTAFSVGIVGSPDQRDSFYPSSWSPFSTGPRSGEHPGWFREPISGTSPEWTPRFEGAYGYTLSKFETMLPQWLRICKCHCEK